MDIGHKMTDDILGNLEKELTKTYNSAFKSAKKEFDVVNKTLAKYKDTMTAEDRLKLWNQRDRLDKLITTLTIDIADTNMIATRMINNELPNVYDLNYSFGAYEVETLSGKEVYSNLYNRNSIKKLLADNVNPFTTIAIDDLKDKGIIHALLKRQFTTAILNGYSISQISDMVKKVMESNGYDSTRIARTETTRIENLGRQDAFEQGEKMGLKLKKKWISTIDGRTRGSRKKDRANHVVMMGEEVGLDKEFSNGLKFPGDISAKASEVVNCRCTMVVEFVGLEKSAKLKDLDDKLAKSGFEVWRDSK